MKHSALRVNGELACKGLFTTYMAITCTLNMLKQKLYEVHLRIVAIRVNCAAKHICRGANF